MTEQEINAQIADLTNGQLIDKMTDIVREYEEMGDVLDWLVDILTYGRTDTKPWARMTKPELIEAFEDIAGIPLYDYLEEQGMWETR